MSEKKPKILCLDDQRENLRIRKMFLEQFGCAVVAVEEARECLQAATREAFDLAILDYHLAGEVTGEDVARDLRVMSPALNLMILTGDPDIPESARECVDAIFIKGLGNPIELIDAIRSLLPDFDLKPRRKPITRAALLESMNRNVS